MSGEKKGVWQNWRAQHARAGEGSYCSCRTEVPSMAGQENKHETIVAAELESPACQGKRRWQTFVVGELVSPVFWGREDGYCSCRTKGHSTGE